MNEKTEHLVVDLADMIEFAGRGIVSKTIAEKPDAKYVLFCLETGQKLSSHRAPFPATIVVLQGKGRFRLGEEIVDVGPGRFIYMPQDLPHGVESTDNLVFFLALHREA